MKKRKKLVSENHPIVQKKIDKTLELSIKEGGTASSAVSIGETYFPAFAIALNATTSQIGILHAMISLLPGIVQLKSAKLLEYFSRKKIVIMTMLIRIFLWIPIILCGWLFYTGFEYTIWILIVLIGLYYSLMATTQVTFFSWIGSLAPKEERGKYFSRRHRAIAFWGLVGMVLSSIFLDLFKSRGEHFGYALEYTLFGFGILFLISIALRLVTIELFKKQYEPKIHVRKKDKMEFRKFMKEITKTPFGKFVLFNSFLMMAVSIASPFWAIYMLRDLGFSYVWYIGVTVATTAFQLMFLPLLGKASDKFGNIRIIKLCTGLMFLIPFTWVLSIFIGSEIWTKVYILIVPSLISGFAWAGFDLSINNYVYDSVGRRKGGYGLSYMNFFSGIGAAVGALIGSGIAILNVNFMNPILFVILISGIARLLVFLIGQKCLEEVRPVKRFSYNYLVKGFAPTRGIVREVHNLNHIVRKVEHYIGDE